MQKPIRNQKQKTAKKKKAAHGGKRDGAGRKPIHGETVLVAARLPVNLIKKLDRFAKKHVCSRSQAIMEAIKHLAD